MDTQGERLAKIETRVDSIDKSIASLNSVYLDYNKMLSKQLEDIQRDISESKHQSALMRGENESIRLMLDNHNKKIYGNGIKGVVEEVKDLKKNTIQLDGWKAGIFWGAWGMLLILLIINVITIADIQKIKDILP
jgi:hypothetical protein